jgi:hypothetical protein
VKAAPASRTRDPDLRWLRPKPVGALRLAFRLPIYLYRLDLGRLLGHRFLLLVHRGRESGLLRETALEVRTGGERYVPEQRFLAPAENHAIICDYGWRHPPAFRVFAKVFGYPMDGTEAARREVAYSLRLVAFRPRDVVSS